MTAFSPGPRSSTMHSPNKSRTLRFCVNYSRLNAVTKRYSYTFPRLDDCCDSLGKARYFITLDCNSGYWQIRIAKEDQFGLADSEDYKKATYSDHIRKYLGMEQSAPDMCFFFKKARGQVCGLQATHVDDSFSCGNEEFENLTSETSKRLESTFLVFISKRSTTDF